MELLELVQHLSATLASAINANPWVALTVLVVFLLLTEVRFTHD
jgi:hypothetical protein